MNAIFDALGRATEIFVSPIDFLGSFWGLTLLSLVSTVGILWVVFKTTPQKRVERSRALMAASIYEVRLFLDSPKRVFLSQGRLLGSSFLYIAYMLPAFVLLSLPLWLAYLHADARLGYDAVPVEQPFVVRVELEPGTDGTKLRPAAEQDGLEITAPPLYDAERDRVYLRAVAHERGDLVLALDVDGKRVEKRVVTDPDSDSFSPERQSGWALLDSVTTEPSLDPAASGVRAIVLSHPARDQSWLGLAIPWWGYSLGLIMIAALVLAKPLGVKL